MIVEDQLDRRMGRISGVEKLEKFDEFATAVAIPDEGVNLAAQQINPGQQTDGAVALVFMIAREGRARRVEAAGPEPWLRSPGYRASRHRRRSPRPRSAFVLRRQPSP